MDKYHFLYKNQVGEWSSCTNPVFIASHTYCRAIPKEVVKYKLGFDFVSDLVAEINGDVLSEKQNQVLMQFDIK